MGDHRVADLPDAPAEGCHHEASRRSSVDFGSARTARKLSINRQQGLSSSSAERPFAQSVTVGGVRWTE
jgi:hypothetical protein